MPEKKKRADYIRVDSFYIARKIILSTRTMRNNLFRIRVKKDNTPMYYFKNKKTVKNVLEKIYAELDAQEEAAYNAEMIVKFRRMLNTPTPKKLVWTEKRWVIHKLLRSGLQYRLRYIRYDYKNDVMNYGFYRCHKLDRIVADVNATYKRMEQKEREKIREMEKEEKRLAEEEVRKRLRDFLKFNYMGEPI